MKALVAVIGFVLGIAFALWLGWVVLTAWRSGAACVAGGKEYRRARDPWAYWAVLSIQASLAVMFLLLALARLLDLTR
jgi:hypothetical protein